MIRVITIAREYGSGGATIARLLADRLGWRLLDRDLVDEVARAANVQPAVVEQLDERGDPWFHGLARSLWMGNADWPISLGEPDLLDAHAVASVARTVIEEAARGGNCVVVGRGAQCILHGRADAFHVFLYAPMGLRRRRMAKRQGRDPGSPDLETEIRQNDRARAAYIRRNFDQEWCNPHLYDLMIDTKCGDETTAEAVLSAARLAPVGAH